MRKPLKNSSLFQENCQKLAEGLLFFCAFLFLSAYVSASLLQGCIIFLLLLFAFFFQNASQRSLLSPTAAGLWIPYSPNTLFAEKPYTVASNYKSLKNKGLAPGAFQVSGNILHETFQHMPYPVLIVNKYSEKIFLANLACQQLPGLKQLQKGRIFSEFFIAPHPNTLLNLEEQHLELRRMNESSFHKNLSARIQSLPQHHELVVFYLTEQKRPSTTSLIHREIHNSSGLLKSLFHHLHDGVMIYDTQGRLLIFNTSAEKYLDIQSQSPPCCKAYSLETQEDISLNSLAKNCLRSKDEQLHFELLITNQNYPDGIFVESFWANITDAEGLIIGTLCVFHDIHQSKAYEQDLLHKIQFEKLLREISGYFIHLNTADLNQGVPEMLRQINTFFAFEGAFITINPLRETTINQELFYQSAHETEFPQQFFEENAWRSFRWFGQLLLGDQDILLEDTSQIPDEAKQEKSFLTASGIQALIVIPVVSTARVQGFIGLYASTPKKFEKEFVNRLRLLGEIMVNALQREKNEKEIRLLNASLEQRVLQRTHELEESNVFLEQEMNNRLKIQKELLKKTLQLEATNREMESFSYSVSHDLRAPLRGINGFSRALLEDYGQSMDDTANDYLNRIILASQKMGDLIDGLLSLSHLSRKEIHHEKVNLSKMVSDIICGLIDHHPERKTDIHIQPDLVIFGDSKLIEIAVENLINNAWKFSGTKEVTYIEVGAFSREDQEIFYVKDKGVGFDMHYAKNLFQAFYRLHSPQEFKGSGIGLATVKRIINKHGGHIWAESMRHEGATFYFVLNHKTI